MKVFYASASFADKYGGPAYSVSRLAHEVSGQGGECALWAPDGSAVDVEVPQGEGRLQLLSGSLAQAITNFGNVDLFHDSGIWMPHNHKIARMAGRKNAPRVISTRGMLDPWAFNHKRLKKMIAWQLYQRRDLRQASSIHVTSQQESKNVERYRLGVPVETLPNGIDLPNISQEKTKISGCKTAVFVGRVHPVKGLTEFIEAWARVKPEGWRFHIVGPDEENHTDALKTKVANYGLSDVILFSDAVKGNAKSELLLSASLFVLPSHSESFGIAVAEALAHGLPVLTTTAVPWPQIEALGCGWRVNPAVTSLETAIRGFANLKQSELSSMGMQGRELVARDFNWDRISRQFIELYTRLMISARSEQT